MSTRTALFKLWSDDIGYGFFLGHNKMRHENSINMLTKVVETPIIVKPEQLPNYKRQDLSPIGNVSIGMLVMQPIELFPNMFLRNNARLLLNGSILVEPSQQILEQVKKIYPYNYYNAVSDGQLRYQLIKINRTKTTDADLINGAAVYVEINKEVTLVSAAYKISDKDEVKEEKLEKFSFYFTVNKKSKKIVIEPPNSNNENNLTKWICLKMSESTNAYGTWLQLLETNKSKAIKKKYDAERMEYLESILSWSLNSYVMLQDKATGIKSRLSYLDLQYADRELKKL